MHVALGKGNFHPFGKKPVVDDGVEHVKHPAPQHRPIHPAQQLVVQARFAEGPEPDAGLGGLADLRVAVRHIEQKVVHLL